MNIPLRKIPLSSSVFCALLFCAAGVLQAQNTQVAGTFKTEDHLTPATANLRVLETVASQSVYGYVDFRLYDLAGKRYLALVDAGVTHLPQNVRGFIKGDGTLMDEAGNAFVRLVPTAGSSPAGLVYEAVITFAESTDGRRQEFTLREYKAIPDQASVDWASIAPAAITTPAVSYQLQTNASVSGYEEWSLSTGHANPAANLARVWVDSSTLKLSCKISTGADCNPAGTGSNHAILSATHTDSLAATVVLGDIVHGNATPAWARLAGNISATKQFLSQTGTGTISAAPAWAAIADADVPDTVTLTNLTQITNRAISDTTGDLAASRVDDGAAASTQALFSGGAGAAGFRAIAAGDLPAGYIDASTDFAAALCGTGQILEDQGASWACIATPAGGGAHNMLSTTHTDSTAAAAARGGLIVGKTATPKWELLVVGGAATFLRSDGTDALWAAIADGDVPNTITIDLAAVATTANSGDSATAFFPSGTLEDARLSANVSLLGQTIEDGEITSITTRSKLPTALVYDDEATTYGAFLQNFGLAKLILPNSATVPATCTVGERYFDNDAPAGQRDWLCTATNVWTVIDEPVIYAASYGVKADSKKVSGKASTTVSSGVVTTPPSATIVSGTGASRTSNVVTITTTAAHDFQIGSTVVIAGVTDSSFNGSFPIATVPTTTTLTYAQTAANATSGSGTASVPQFTSADVGKTAWVYFVNQAPIIVASTITTFNSSTSITLSNVANQTATNTATLVWGSDDSDALLAAYEAAKKESGGSGFATAGLGAQSSARRRLVLPAGLILFSKLPFSIDGNVDRSSTEIVGQGADATVFIPSPGFTFPAAGAGILFHSVSSGYTVLRDFGYDSQFVVFQTNPGDRPVILQGTAPVHNLHLARASNQANSVVLFKFATSGARSYNLRIEGATTTCAIVSANNIESYGLEVANCGSASVHGFRFVNANDFHWFGGLLDECADLNCASLENSKRIVFDGVRVVTPTPTTSNAIKVDATSSLILDSVTIFGQAGAQGDGIDIAAGGELRMDKSRFEHVNAIGFGINNAGTVYDLGGNVIDAGKYNGALAIVPFDAANAIRLNAAAAAGRYLKGDGANFVMSAGSASGTGSCTNQFVRTLTSDAAPTCATVTDADVVDTITATNYVLKAGDIMTGNLEIDNQKELRLYELDANGVNYFAQRAPAAMAANITVLWNITADCTGNANGGALTINGSFEIVCADDDAATGVTGTGTTNQLAVWTSSTAIGAFAAVVTGSNIAFPAEVTATSFRVPGGGGTPIEFEGTTEDAFETQLVVTDPTADRTFRIPNANSVAIQFANAPANQFMRDVSSEGVITFAQVNFTNLAGSIAIGQTPLTTRGDLLIATTATPVLGRLAVGATGTVLHGGTEPSYSAVSLTVDVTGTLPIASGGTGATTSQAAMNALSQLTTEGDLLFRNATDSTRLARGTNGQCLTSTATTLAWGACGSGTGITTLNTLTATTQLLAKLDDTNVTLAIGSATDTHTFTLGWTGTLAKARQNAATAYIDAAQTFTTLQTFNPGTTPALGLHIDIAAPGASQNRDSHAFRMSGRSNDGTNHSSDWEQEVDVTTNPGASNFRWKTRIDAAAFVTKMTLDDAGKLSVVDIVNVVTGFRIGDAAASGNVLRGNGTNFVSATLALTDLTTFASADLAGRLTNETGGGAAVFADAPTLTGLLTVGHTVEFTETAGDPTCAAGNYSIKANSTSGKVRGCENGALFDVNTAGGSSHAILSATHTDSTAAAAARGGLIVGKTATPKWELLVIGGAATFLRSDGTDVAWAAITDADVPDSITITLAATATALAANPADCAANQFANAIAASGNLTCAAIADADIPAAITRDSEWPSATATLTNKTLDVEGTGNVLTTVSYVTFMAAACQNATATLLWDTPTASPAVAACITGTNTQKGVADFADAANLSMQTTFPLPRDWSGAVDARFKWLTSATTGDVVWQLATICVADAETDDPAFNTASTVTDTAKGTANQTNDADITGVTMTGCAAGELLHLKVFRDSAHASDSLAATARLVSLELTLRRAQ